MINLKLLCIRSKNDNFSFHMLQAMGAKIFELEDLEKTDETISKLINEDYKLIFLSNEIAGFSEDILKKYANSTNVNIIIAPSNRI